MVLNIMVGFGAEGGFDETERCSFCHAYIPPLLWVRCYDMLVGICGRCVGELQVAKEEATRRLDKYRRWRNGEP